MIVRTSEDALPAESKLTSPSNFEVRNSWRPQVCAGSAVWQVHATLWPKGQLDIVFLF
jgi:hypothetical protein